MANLNWIEHFGSTVVFDGSFISDDLFDISDDELAMFAAFCQKHDIYFISVIPKIPRDLKSCRE